MENLQSIAELQPDYMGFIFYEKSKRNFEGIIPKLSAAIKKTGVFVNADVSEVIDAINQHDLQAVQLHGDESVEYIKLLNRLIVDSAKNFAEVIKVFGIKDEFDFTILEPFKDIVTYFLFDTKGKERGGNGVKFDWSVLQNYPYSKPFFLSGGIGPEDIEEVKKIQSSGLSVYAVDINSRFEIKPGLKNVKEVKKFKKDLKD